MAIATAGTQTTLMIIAHNFVETAQQLAGVESCGTVWYTNKKGTFIKRSNKRQCPVSSKVLLTPDLSAGG